MSQCFYGGAVTRMWPRRLLTCGFAMMEAMHYGVVQICLSFMIGAERIEMSTLTVRLTEREERDLLLACEQTGKSKSEVVRELLADSLRT